MTQDNLRVLLWHWGRNGAGPKYSFNMAQALGQRDDLQLSLSYSRQSDQLAGMRGLGLPSLEVETFTSAPTAVLKSATLPGVRREFSRFLRGNAIDIVYCPMMHPWDLFMLSAIRSYGSQYVTTVHESRRDVGFPSSVFQGRAEKEILRADGVVTLTEHVRKELLERLEVTTPTAVIPHAAFEFQFPPLRTPLEEGPLRVLFLGRVVPYKGLDLLLEATSALSPNDRSRIHLTIAGEGDLGPYRSQLARAGNLSVTNRWLSEVDIAEALAAADVVIIPYREASQSGVIAAAFGAGRPVIVTPVGGLTEQVQDGVTGLVADSVDPDSIGSCLLRLAQDATLLEELQMNVRNYTQRELSWEASAGKLFEFMHILGGARG